MKKRSILIAVISIISFFIVGFLGAFLYYKANLNPVDVNNHEEVEFIITSGTPTSTIISTLKEKDLIKNDLALKIYVKLHPGVPKAGRYIFDKSMSSVKIYDDIINGRVKNDTIWVTFVEGKRLSYIAEQISKNFPYTVEEVNEVLEDKEFIKILISKYSVLTDDVFNDKIYHPLEGYLFCDTYEFVKDISIKGIIEKMVATLDSKMSKYSDEIEKSKLSIHEIMTLASIVELEGARSNDRKGVAGVFYNRLNSGWTLGSDVTTYYAVNKDFSRDLTWSDLRSCNGYNTRGACVKGLPVGPIASASMQSIEATIEPENHSYYYFVADKNGKTYFSKTDAEHNRIIRELQSKGLWYTY